MAIQLNQQGDCTTNLLGTGLDACIKEYGDLVGIDLYLKGTFALNTTTDTFPNLVAYKLLIQGKTLFPINNIFDFEQTTPDNEIATSSRGIQREIRAGKPQFTTTWSNGGCFHESVFDKKGQDTWDIALKFETGVLFATNIAGTILKPFTNGMFSPASFKLQQAADPNMTTAAFQFPSAEEWNTRKVFFTFDELGYDQNTVNGVLNTTVEFPTAPAAGTTFSLSVLSKCNTSVVVTGLDDANEWKLNGVQASSTTISTVTFNITTNQYDFTVTPALIATDTLAPSLADVAAGFDVAVNTAGDLFQGQALLTTVV